MFLQAIQKEITTVVLCTFLIFSVVPVEVFTAPIKVLQEREAIFGWHKLNRIKKKTKALVQCIEELKQGKSTIEEATLQIADIKEYANKAFKKNYKVFEIVKEANRRIESYMQNLTKTKPQQLKNAYGINDSNHFEPVFSQKAYKSIELFVKNLQNYEDSHTPLQVLKKVQESNSSKQRESSSIDEVEAKILFAYIAIFCGCLLCMIPTAITQGAGSSLIGGGMYVLGEDAWCDVDEKNRNTKGENK